MKITLLAIDKIKCRITIWCINSFQCLKQWKFLMQKLQWTRNGKSLRQFQHGKWKKSKAKRRSSKRHRITTIKSTLHHWWTCIIWRMRSRYHNSKSTKDVFVLRGDILKDDSGAYAVFTEQGSSASQMTAAKVMDVTARLPECDGQAADAISAYTQVKIEDAPKLLKIQKSECPDVWILLPKHKWPQSWNNIVDPVGPLERNLYGHPLSSLLWERQFEKSLMELGWEKVTNWECLFVHRKQKVILIGTCERH